MKAIKVKDQHKAVAQITGQYLFGLATQPVEVSAGEATRMEVLLKAMANTTEQGMRDALRDLPKCGKPEQKSYLAKCASMYRAIYRVTVATGSIEWAKGLGMNKAYDTAREKMAVLKIRANGKPALDKAEREEKAAEKHDTALVALATTLARKDGKALVAENFAEYKAKAQAQMDREWATEYAANLLKECSAQQVAFLLEAVNGVLAKAAEVRKAA